MTMKESKWRGFICCSVQARARELWNIMYNITKHSTFAKFLSVWISGWDIRRLPSQWQSDTMELSTTPSKDDLIQNDHEIKSSSTYQYQDDNWVCNPPPNSPTSGSSEFTGVLSYPLYLIVQAFTFLSQFLFQIPSNLATALKVTTPEQDDILNTMPHLQDNLKQDIHHESETQHVLSDEVDDLRLRIARLEERRKAREERMKKFKEMEMLQHENEDSNRKEKALWCRWWSVTGTCSTNCFYFLTWEILLATTPIFKGIQEVLKSLDCWMHKKLPPSTYNHMIGALAFRIFYQSWTSC